MKMSFLPKILFFAEDRVTWSMFASKVAKKVGTLGGVQQREQHVF